MKEKNINEEQIEKVNKKGMFLIVFLLLILVLSVIGVTYQVYLYAGEGLIGDGKSGNDGRDGWFGKIIGKDSEVGAVTIIFNEGKNKILIDNMMPVSDSKGKKLIGTNTVMDFTVNITVHKKSRVVCEVSALKQDNSTIPEKYVKMYVERGTNGEQLEDEILPPTIYTPLEEDTSLGTPKGSMILDKITATKSIAYNYRLRMWLDSNYPVDNVKRYFTVKVNTVSQGERIR